MSNKILAEIDEHLHTVEYIKENLVGELEDISNLIFNALTLDKKVFLFGNGGSAADAQHIAAELVGRYESERKGLNAIALTTDTSILTAVANDYGFENVFSRQLEALCSKDDIVIGISTSGNSPNVVHGLIKAKEIGAITVGLTGRDGGKMKELCRHCIIVKHEKTSRIQEMHIFIGHLICGSIDDKISLI